MMHRTWHDLEEVCWRPQRKLFPWIQLASFNLEEEVTTLQCLLHTVYYTQCVLCVSKKVIENTKYLRIKLPF